ncbi:hypothetical protein RI367_007968 [Sorochytrium milnesiophthora]
MTSAPLIGRRMLRRLRFALFAVVLLATTVLLTGNKDDKIAVSYAAFPAAPSPKLHNNSAYPPLYNWRAHPTVFDLDVAQSQITYRVTTDHSKAKADVPAMDAVREMMLHAWRPYQQHAMGFDHYRPLGRDGGNWMCDNGAAGMAATLIDAMPTLHIMGLQGEFDVAARHMLEQVVLSKDNSCNTFETTIRVLGGLNSVHSLTQDRRFLTKAVEMADALLPAFTKAPAGIPYSEVNFKTGAVGGYDNNLSGAGSYLIEFGYLSKVTGDSKYLKTAEAAMRAITSRRPANMPYPVKFVTATGTVISDRLYITVGATADSFYEYLLKASLLLGDNAAVTHYRAQYDEAIDMLLSYVVVNDNGRVNLAEGNIDKPMSNFVQHLACFAGGMLMLGAVTGESADRNQIFQIGLDYTETCYGLYKAWADKGLPPDEADLPNYTIRTTESTYNLRPEVAESIFYAWRFTHDPKYREWAMNIAKAINSTARVETGGFAALSSVTAKTKADRQESYFLSETLKYLYLTFTDDDTMPLDKWVFNTEAHPVRRQQQQQQV